MKYVKCKTCGYWDWQNEHSCPPKWEAVLDGHNDEDDPYETHGHNAEEAVEHLVQSKFSDWEYPDEMTIQIRKAPTGLWETFDITVQPVPNFDIVKRN